MVDERVTFRRSGIQMAVDGCAAPVAAVAFLGIAVLFALGVITEDVKSRLLGAGMFGFFGIFLAFGAATAAGRRTDDRVAMVGSTGIWLPEMGYLPWTAIAEVRLETHRGLGAGDAPVTVGYRRLGVVPRDPALRPKAATAGGAGLARLYVAFVRRIAPQIRLGIDDPAPFGAGEPEISRADFDRLLQTTRRYVDVVDAAERRARTHAPRWTAAAAAASPSSSAPGHETSLAEIADLDAGLTPGASSRPATTAGSASLVDPATLATEAPRASIGAPTSSLLGLVGRLVPMAISVLWTVGFSVAASTSGGDGGLGWFALTSVVVTGVLVIATFRPFFAELRRRREIAANPVSLEVGPDGIRVPPGRLVPWGEVAEVRTERAGFTTVSGGPVERWRLVIVPAAGTHPGAALSIDSDRLDARFDDVLDLVRFYHPVVETG